MDLYGECLCGVVKYEYKGEIGQVVNCHCTECRKWHGAAFRTRTVADKNKFTWIKGENEVAYYDGLPNVIKTFCKICGSNLISLYKDNDQFIGLPLGGVEFDEGVIASLKPACHVFVSYKANWYDITDVLPQYKELPDAVTSIHDFGDN